MLQLLFLGLMGGRWLELVACLAGLVDLGLGFLCLDLLAGGCPAATRFSLLRQRKVSKRKAIRLSGSLRFAAGDLRCLRKMGVRANSLHCVALRQRAALIPFFPGSAGPARTGQAGMKIQTAKKLGSKKTLLI